ncbi:glycerophosphodiester phosphodiesterase family protein [Streptomyces sp. NPDC001667]
MSRPSRLTRQTGCLSRDCQRGRCRNAGIKVMAWTVNNRRDLDLACALGLAGAVTDFPG